MEADASVHTHENTTAGTQCNEDAATTTTSTTPCTQQVAVTKHDALPPLPPPPPAASSITCVAALVGAPRRAYRITLPSLAHTFAVPSRYSLRSLLGHGAYGHVFDATDAGTGGSAVAIKCVPRWTRDLSDAKCTLREVAMLHALAPHPHIMRLLAVDVFDDDVLCVMPRFEADMASIVASDQPLMTAHVRSFTAQLVRAVQHMHAAGVMHRDLKPANLLVNSNCYMVVADFGLARAGVGSAAMTTTACSSSPCCSSPCASAPAGAAAVAEPPAPLRGSMQQSYPQQLARFTMPVVTRWYRAPELLRMQAESGVAKPRDDVYGVYGLGVDMWAVGCIIAEWFVRAPVFAPIEYATKHRGGSGARAAATQAAAAATASVSEDKHASGDALWRAAAATAVSGHGTSEDAVLERIVVALGPRPPHPWSARCGCTGCADVRLAHKNGTWPLPRSLLADDGPIDDASARHLLRRLLTWHPADRWSADMAAEHPFVRGALVPKLKPAVSTAARVDAGSTPPHWAPDVLSNWEAALAVADTCRDAVVNCMRTIAHYVNVES